MQNGLVPLVLERRQDLPLCLADIRQHGQRLVGVRRQDYRIEILGSAVFRCHAHTVREALHRDDRAIQTNAVRKGPSDGFDIACRAALYRLPLRVTTYGRGAHDY